jgi:hypothetical protein
LKRSGTIFHRPQSTAWSILCEDVSHCMRQIVVTPDTYWFSYPCPCNSVTLDCPLAHQQQSHLEASLPIAPQKLLQGELLLQGLRASDVKDWNAIYREPLTKLAVSHPLHPYLFFKVSGTNRCISVFPVMWKP